ncbi:hypothetical protein JTB14_015332 [Gonioctena quinquepunctata]|nr:hypothetical protein JTB14_015332 [Gonioctena quinquepunctata]
MGSNNQVEEDVSNLVMPSGIAGARSVAETLPGSSEQTFLGMDVSANNPFKLLFGENEADGETLLDSAHPAKLEPRFSYRGGCRDPALQLGTKSFGNYGKSWDTAWQPGFKSGRHTAMQLTPEDGEESRNIARQFDFKV